MDAILALRTRRLLRRITIRNNRANLYELRLRSTPFDLEDVIFQKKFRLTKSITKELIAKLWPFSTPSCIPFEIQVLTALNLYGQGSYQDSVGNNHLLGLSQPSVSRSIKVVTTSIVNNLMGTIIRFPQTLMEKVEVQEGFNMKFGMSSVLGAVDGTHIAIVSPPEMNDNTRGNLYINRKEYHSINVLVCCDSKMRITYVNARFPGSVHDSAIWLLSEPRKYLKSQFTTEENQEAFLIGDSGFPLEPWLLTPFNTTTEGTPEHNYNKNFIKARQIVERCFGVLKNRFRCLMVYRVLHYSPYMAGMIIYAVICLHNICIEKNVYDTDELESVVSGDNANEETIPQWHSLGEQVRQRYITENY